MSGYQLLSEPTHWGETEEDWADFPPAQILSLGAALSREANHKRVGGAVVTSVGIALRGLLVTTTAVATVAYLLLTNSHI
jgi:hypothetical protein